MRRPRKPSARHRHKPDAEARRVGQRVRKLRLARDFNFDAFVEELGMGRGYVSELERGLVVPSLTALKKIADALGLTMADVVLGDSEREQVFEATLDAPVEKLRMLLAQLK